MKLLGLLLAIVALIICGSVWLGLAGVITYAFFVASGPLTALGVLLGLIAISLMCAQIHWKGSNTAKNHTSGGNEARQALTRICFELRCTETSSRCPGDPLCPSIIEHAKTPQLAEALRAAEEDIQWIQPPA
jgi:hypothetical protein